MVGREGWREGGPETKMVCEARTVRRREAINDVRIESSKGM